MPKPDRTALPVETVPIEKIKTDPDNARKHNRRNLDVIRASLSRFGQRKPLVVNGRYMAIAGNGTVEVMRELNAEAAEQDQPAPYAQVHVTRFPGTTEEARAYAIADNRSGELAEWEQAVLAEQLDGFNASLLDAAGFDQVELDEILAAAAKAEAGGSQYGEQQFPGQQPHAGMAALGERYEGKATRSLYFEYTTDLFAWVVERLNDYRTAHELPSNAEALIAVVAAVSGRTPPAGQAEGDGQLTDPEAEPEQAEEPSDA
jgi:hypothetical protein